jgi:cell wall assembly regulator SMI1
MPVPFEVAAPPASEEALRQVEQHLGIELPDDHRGFLAEHNGGYLEPNAHPNPVGASVRLLYSAGPADVEELDDLESMAELYSPEGEADDELLPGFLPIGEDDGGNLILLDVKGDSPGSVHFWEHEMTPPEEAYTRLNDNFSEFWEALAPR